MLERVTARTTVTTLGKFGQRDPFLDPSDSRAMNNVLPFELEHRRGAWGAFWKEQRLRIKVVSPPEQLDPARVATLAALVRDWPRTRSTIEAFLRTVQGHVPLDPPSAGGFDASSCGFDEPLGFCAIEIDADDPSEARIHFDTGLPDGYVMYTTPMSFICEEMWHGQASSKGRQGHREGGDLSADVSTVPATERPRMSELMHPSTGAAVLASRPWRSGVGFGRCCLGCS